MKFRASIDQFGQAIIPGRVGLDMLGCSAFAMFCWILCDQNAFYKQKCNMVTRLQCKCKFHIILMDFARAQLARCVETARVELRDLPHPRGIKTAK